MVVAIQSGKFPRVPIMSEPDGLDIAVADVCHRSPLESAGSMSGFDRTAGQSLESALLSRPSLKIILIEHRILNAECLRNIDAPP
jgi:hypothetical protein